LPAKKNVRGSLGPAVLPKAVVENDDAQRVQELSLVLVDPLHLTIEDVVRVDRLTGRRAEPVGELHLRLSAWPSGRLRESVHPLRAA
jgi:hypothetical protein